MTDTAPDTSTWAVFFLDGALASQTALRILRAAFRTCSGAASEGREGAVIGCPSTRHLGDSAAQSSLRSAPAVDTEQCGLHKHVTVTCEMILGGQARSIRRVGIGGNMPSRFARISVAFGVALAVLAVAVPANAHTPRLRKPSAPTDVVATPRSPNAIQVSWAPPATDGGAPITSYTVTVGSVGVSCTTTSTSCVVGGYGGSLYYFGGGYGSRGINNYRIKVVATNSVAPGRPAKLRSTTANPAEPICSYIGPYAFLGTVCGITNWSGLDLDHAWLLTADLAGANLSNTDLEGGVTDGNFSNTDLNGADLAGVSFGGNGVTSGGITGIPAQLPSGYILFDGYIVGEGAHLENVNFAGANFAGLELAGDDFTGADLAGTDFAGADLTGVSFHNADLAGADVTGANLILATWFDTTCPDGTNSNNDGQTCLHNL
jgi:hypothetical protein